MSPVIRGEGCKNGSCWEALYWSEEAKEIEERQKEKWSGYLKLLQPFPGNGFASSLAVLCLWLSSQGLPPRLRLSLCVLITVTAIPPPLPHQQSGGNSFPLLLVPARVTHTCWFLKPSHSSKQFLDLTLFKLFPVDFLSNKTHFLWKMPDVSSKQRFANR